MCAFLFLELTACTTEMSTDDYPLGFKSRYGKQANKGTNKQTDRHDQYCGLLDGRNIQNHHKQLLADITRRLTFEV